MLALILDQVPGCTAIGDGLQALLVVRHDVRPPVVHHRAAFMSTTRSLPCGSANDAAALRNYITTYSTHPNQLIYNGLVFASTFSGESCQFGQSSVQAGWSSQFLQQLSGENAVYFLPSFFVATSAFQGFEGVINGMFNVRVMNCCPVYCSNTLFFFPS